MLTDGLEWCLVLCNTDQNHFKQMAWSGALSFATQSKTHLNSFEVSEADLKLSTLTDGLEWFSSLCKHRPCGGLCITACAATLI